MNVQNIEKKEHNVATFEVLVDAAAFDAEVNKVYLRNKKQLYIPGFRKGKAPRAVIEGMYGKVIFYEEALRAMPIPLTRSALRTSISALSAVRL